MPTRLPLKPLARLLTALGSTLLTFSAAHALDGKPAVDRNTLVVALSSEPGNLDPQVAASIDSAKFAWNVFDTLYGFDLQGNLEPRLATAYKLATDGRSYTFTLRRGVKFHNGAAFTAQDVKYSLDRILLPETKSTRRPFFVNSVEGIDVPDEHTVVIRLKKRDGAFLNKVAGYLYIVPKAYTESLKTPEEFALKPVGTGPYRFVSHQIGRSLELARFDDFWGNKPGVVKIQYRFIPEASSRVNAVLAGEVDLSADIVPTDVERLQGSKGLVVESVPGGSPVYVRIYSNDPATPFSKQGVRLALNYALDKEALIRSVFRGQAAPLASHIPASYPWGSNKSLKPFEYDPAKARKLLADAGYPQGFDTSLLCTTPTFERAFCEALAAYWGQVGVRTQIRIVDSTASNRLNNTHQSGPLFLSHFGNAIYEPIHVIGGSIAKDGTWSDYDNPAVQKLIEQVEGEGDHAKREDLFNQILKLARDDGQGVLIAEPKLNYVRDPALQWKPQIGGWSLNFRSVSWK